MSGPRIENAAAVLRLPLPNSHLSIFFLCRFLARARALALEEEEKGDEEAALLAPGRAVASGDGGGRARAGSAGLVGGGERLAGVAGRRLLLPLRRLRARLRRRAGTLLDLVPTRYGPISPTNRASAARHLDLVGGGGLVVV